MFNESNIPMPSIETLLDQCRQLAANGQLSVALERLQEAGAVYAQFPPLQELLASLLRQAGRNDEAINALLALVRLEPRNHLRHTDLASVYYDLKRLPDAEQHARQAMALNPLNAQAHNLLGMIYLDIQQPEEAEFHFRQLLLIHEPLAPVCANLANAYKSMGKLDQAELFFRHTLELDPGNIEGCLSWVRMEEARRNPVRALELLQRAERIDPSYPGLAIARSVVLRREKKFDDALAILDQSATRDRNERSPAFHFERGDVLDKLGRYPEAFASYASANRLVQANVPHRYNAAGQSAHMERLKSFFTRAGLAPLMSQRESVRIGLDTPQPIFIVGFPRSGTTLTEQILASHPSVSAGDELDYLHRLTALAPHFCGSGQAYPECLNALALPGHGRFIEKFRDYYLCNAELRGVVDQRKKWFTDKMPLNEMHLGLIHLTFPSSPIIHVIRHPLDVVLSTFFTDLTHGGYCSFALETAARHYALVFELIEHYRKELDLNYLPIRYEDLVADPEPYVRTLLDFVGEPFDENCLSFHENQRYARTASYAQVSEKLYTRSRFRFRNYLDFLEPVIPILLPAIERLGYTLE